ncbi:BLUF domain-containing protein [Aureimonas populi]|uniref:BLUF domain-containing protein n=1 Tax=Aureimonas populi TaxID=1701758 RepID=A0ABW5CPN7_9HYPH|nr:BLUF domain-containing protein [Aureimonas populi]
MSLYQLVYYSRNHIAGEESDLAREVEAILDTSRRNNERAGVTGALLFNAGCFAQILEGPLEAVESTFERIQQDERHGDVSVLAIEPIEERSFATWAMGFVGRSSKNAYRFAEIGLSSGFDPEALDKARIHALLKDLVRDEEGLAA